MRLPGRFGDDERGDDAAGTTGPPEAAGAAHGDAATEEAVGGGRGAGSGGERGDAPPPPDTGPTEETEDTAEDVSRPAAEAAAAIRAAAEAAASGRTSAVPDEPPRAPVASVPAPPSGEEPVAGAEQPVAGAEQPAAANGAATVDAQRVERLADLRLARVHLRTGAFALARAELEMLAGEERLDLPGMLDLAEVRWRTGDLAGAAEAAASYGAAGGDEALGYVIAAEGAAAADRPAEARRLAGKALERSEASLETIFAGIPRSMIWPHDTWAEPAGAFFAPRADGGPASKGSHPGQPGQAEMALQKPVPARRETQQPGLWETAAPEQEPLDADSEIAAAAAALAVGDDALAALHLGVAVRLAPSAAGAVIQAIANRREPLLELVRGDALRLLGYEWDARRAYLSVAAGLRAARETEAEDLAAGDMLGPAPGS